VSQSTYHNLNELTYSGYQDIFVPNVTSQQYVFVFPPFHTRSLRR